MGSYRPPSPWTHGGQSQPGRCFAAASEWAERAGWAYAEGYALVRAAAPFTCFEHVWCLTDEGLVADPALPDGAAAGYFGIALSHRFRRQQQLARGTDAVFVSDPKNILVGINEQLLRSVLPDQALSVPGMLPVRSARSLRRSDRRLLQRCLRALLALGMFNHRPTSLWPRNVSLADVTRYTVVISPRHDDQVITTTNALQRELLVGRPRQAPADWATGAASENLLRRRRVFAPPAHWRHHGRNR
ncbi:hypothetical protein ACQEV2_00065 [Streptomyces sp. CA-251387]|uniref:hypothetical protein n=1 Tax=Streptomyces sp. CA-251387 TaxID=3240064 RepID=UPI003D8C0C0B